MGCHPNPIDEVHHIFQAGHIAPPTRNLLPSSSWNILNMFEINHWRWPDFYFFHRVQVGWAQGSGWEWRDFWTILAGLCALWLRNEWKNVTMEHGDSFAGVLKVDVVKNPCQFKCRWYRYVLIEMYTTLHIHTLRSIALRSNTMLCYTRQHNTRQYNTIQHNTNVRVFVE